MELPVHKMHREVHCPLPEDIHIPSEEILSLPIVLISNHGIIMDLTIYSVYCPLEGGTGVSTPAPPDSPTAVSIGLWDCWTLSLQAQPAQPKDCQESNFWTLTNRWLPLNRAKCTHQLLLLLLSLCLVLYCYHYWCHRYDYCHWLPCTTKNPYQFWYLAYVFSLVPIIP